MKATKTILFDGLFAMFIIFGLSTCDSKMNPASLVAMEDSSYLLRPSAK